MLEFLRTPMFELPITVWPRNPSGRTVRRDGHIRALSEYYPWIDPGFNDDSRRMLDLKGDNPPEPVVLYYVSLLESHFGSKSAGTLCLVPRHVSGPAGRGLTIVARRFIEARPAIVDGLGVLRRTRTVSKQATQKGRRSLWTHIESVEVTDQSRVVDQDVMVLDDITSSRCSLVACTQLLLEAGASLVTPVALAQTVRSY